MEHADKTNSTKTTKPTVSCSTFSVFSRIIWRVSEYLQQLDFPYKQLFFFINKPFI